MGLHVRDVGDADYLLIVNMPELYKRAIELEYRNAILLEGDKLDPEDIGQLKKCDKFPLFLLYMKEREDACSSISDQMNEAGIDSQVFNLTKEGDLFDAIEFFPRKYYVEQYLFSERKINKCDKP